MNSAKANSKPTYNPITGQEVLYAKRSSSSLLHQRPKEIPALQLESDREQSKQNNDLQYKPTLPSPSTGRSSTSVSWGPPSQRHIVRPPFALHDEATETEPQPPMHSSKESVSGATDISVYSRKQDVTSARNVSQPVPPLLNKSKHSADKRENAFYSERGRNNNSIEEDVVQHSSKRNYDSQRQGHDPRHNYNKEDPYVSESHRSYATPRNTAEKHLPGRDTGRSSRSSTIRDVYHEAAAMNSDEEKRENFFRSKFEAKRNAARNQGSFREIISPEENRHSSPDVSDDDKFYENDYEEEQQSESDSVRSSDDSLQYYRPNEERAPPLISPQKKRWDDVSVADEQVQVGQLPSSSRSLTTDRITEEMQSLWKQTVGPKSTRSRYGERESEIVESILNEQSGITTTGEHDRSRHLLQSAIKHVPGMSRGSIRPLHESKIQTSSKDPDQLLSNKVRFSARLVVARSQDAIRDLTGFYFHSDASLTIYEYRNLSGKSAKALPLLKRATYECCWGRCKGEPYSLLDIFEGNTLYIQSSDLNSLPQSLRSLSILKVRITDIDQDAKIAALSQDLKSRVPDSQWPSLLARLHITRCPIAPKLQLRLRDLHERVREDQLLMRSAIGIWTALYSVYRNTAESIKGTRYTCESVTGCQLSRNQLEAGLNKVRLKFSEMELDLIWLAVDPELTNEVTVHFTEYMRLALGEMNEARRRNVRKAYLKMDTAKNGYITITDIHRFYRILPKKGASKEEIHDPVTPDIEFLLEALRFTSRQDIVFYEEFEIFYEGLSAQVDIDEEFIVGLKRAWNI